MNEWIPLMVIMPMLCAVIVSAFNKWSKPIKILALIFSISIPAIALIANYGMHYFGGYAPMIDTFTGVLYHPSITYIFNILQKIFIFVLGVVTFLVVLIYINKYKKASGQYLFLIFMGTASAIALLLTDDIFNMFVFFEILALTQVGIVAASRLEGNFEMALRYMILGAIGSPMMLLGIGFLLATTGSVNITDIISAIQNGIISAKSPVFLMSCGLIFFGWLYASGLPPFHTIKSGMYSKAEPHAAALLQCFTVISMISILLIMYRIFHVIEFFELLVIIFSAIAMILGITMALTQTDFRRMIGFLAVGELGFIGLGIGLYTQFAITAGLFQALNEMIITALLFLGFGAIVYTTGETDTRKLGGLLQYHPKVGLMILVGGLAMAGVPPLNGFRSKLMLIQASLSCGYPELSLLAIIVSIATFVVFVKIFYTIFLRPKPKELQISKNKLPKSMVFAMGILLIMIIVIGICPNIVTYGISQYVGGVLL